MKRTLLRNALIVLLIALAVRWTADVVLQPHLNSYVIDSYDVIGQNLLDGHGFSYQAGKTIPTVTRAPFYPLWWAGLLAVVGRHFLVLRMAEGFVDALTAALIVFMTAALCRLPLSRAPPQLSRDDAARGERRALIVATLAGAIYAIQPWAIYYAAKMGTETWFTLWLVLSLWCFAAWCRSPGYGRGAALGAVLGILLLNKSTAVGLVILLVVLGLVWARKRRKAVYLSLVLSLAIAALVVTPWMVRDYRVSGGRLVPIQTLTWWNFWSDFSFSSSGSIRTMDSHYGPGGGHPYALSAEADVRQEALLRSQALAWMSAHPSAMLGKMGHNLIEFWYLVEGTRRAQIAGASMAFELLLACVGGWLGWRSGRRRMVLFTAIVILYFDVVYTPIKSVFHYSLVVVPLLCVLQAFLLAWIVARVMDRRSTASSHGQ